MVLSGYFLKIPYHIAWQTRRLTGKLDGVVFYLESVHDFSVIEYLLPHINDDYVIAAKDKALAKKLRGKGLEVKVWPVFPLVVVMARHALHRFPVAAVKKIGMRHGPYHFKKMISSKRYNTFDLFLFTSAHEVEIASQLGIRCGAAGGYPRLDAFKDPVVIQQSRLIWQQQGFVITKKTLLFTTTWDRSGLSAVDKWIDHLPALQQKYNLIISLHPMMSAHLVQKVNSTPGIFVGTHTELPASMLLADVLVSDTSSVIAEFLPLNKPVITFKVNPGPRLSEEIQEMIREISTQVDYIDELQEAVSYYQHNISHKEVERKKWNHLIFDDTDTSHGIKAAKVINHFISWLKK